MLGYGKLWALQASRLKSKVLVCIETRVGASTLCRQNLQNQGKKTHLKIFFVKTILLRVRLKRAPPPLLRDKQHMKRTL